jgi:hypothetical protein
MSVKRGRGVKMLINVDGRSTIFLFNPKNVKMPTISLWFLYPICQNIK